MAISSPAAPANPAAPERPATSSAEPAPARLVSLDALRGFDMFWILSGTGVAAALSHLGETGIVGFLARQLDHVPWQGLAFFDLIFPLFLFIVGVSTVLSLEKVRARHGLRGALRRILIRGLLLFVCGLIYSGGLRNGWDQVRWLNVLQRIAICYTATAILYCALRPRALAAVTAGILLGYWALMAWVPIRDINLERSRITAQQAATGATPQQLYDQTSSYVRGSYEDGRNLAHHVDFLILPGRKYDGLYDPEGLLSTIPSIATCLLGVFIGLLLRRPRSELSDEKKVRWLLYAGVAGIAGGWLWGLWFPVIKKIWTSSYVLVTAGLSCLLLALFIQLIDIKGHRRWAMPFVWIGMNPIAIYMLRKFCDFGAIASAMVGGPIAAAFGRAGPLLVTAVEMSLAVWVCWFLYQRKIFLRL